MPLKLKDILPAKEPPLNPRSKIIPVSQPLFNGNELEYVTKCIKTGWVSSLGRYVEEFEKEFSRYCGARYGISCSSGTAALHLALASIGIGKSDEVIIPSFTMISTANAVAYQGAKPVLVDSKKNTFNIDPEKIEEKITPRTKAIIAVHIYGHPADMDKILKIARKHRLYVIEDAAEAHGAEYKGRKVGGIGDVGCFSFYGNKIITTGEGGMAVTNSRKIKEKADYLRDLAFSKDRHFWHCHLGFNYRMSNLQAAVGLAQLERIKELIRIKRHNAKIYNKLLKDIRGITLPKEESYAKNVYWMYAILVQDEFGVSRDKLRKILAQKGIETRVFFIPIHLQPIYSKICKGEFPVAEESCRKGLYLPSGLNLKKNEIKFIAESIKKASN
jgi:perosamine synthetase